jgi:hypothetical protein
LNNRLAHRLCDVGLTYSCIYNFSPLLFPHLDEKYADLKGIDLTQDVSNARDYETIARRIPLDQSGSRTHPSSHERIQNVLDYQKWKEKYNIKSPALFLLQDCIQKKFHSSLS